MKTALQAIVLCAGAAVASTASAVITFDDMGVHGQLVGGSTFTSGQDSVTVSARNHVNRFSGAAMIFDARFGGRTSDSDLVGTPFSGGGNLVKNNGQLVAGATAANNLIVVADYLDGSRNDGIVNNPSDEGSKRKVDSLGGGRVKLAGSITFDLGADQGAGVLSLGIVDVESGSAKRSSVFLLDDGVVVYSFDLDDTDSLLFGETSFGDNSYNDFSVLLPLTKDDGSAFTFDKIVLEAGGSLGVAYLGVPSQIPAPGAFALAGAAGVLAVRRRRA